MRGEIIKKDNGWAEITPNTPVIAGSRGKKWIITYTVGKIPLKPGGGIRIDIPYGFTAPQVMYPGYPGYIKAVTPNKKVKLTPLLFDTKVKRAWGSEYWQTEGKNNVFKISFWAYQVFIKVVEGELSPGEKIEVRYGFAEWPPGAGTVEVPKFSQNFEFTIATDVDGRRSAPLSGYYLIEKSPTLRVIGGEVEKVDVYRASSINSLSKRRKIKLVARDKYGNLSEQFIGKVRIDKKKFSFKGYGEIEALPSKISKSTFEIIGVKENKKIPFQVNPYLYSPKEDYSIYWGDLHTHTKFSDGLGTPEECYEFAKNVSGLDFAAVADHSGHFSIEEWEHTLKVNNQYNQPGKFVTLHGFELNVGGDRNVYYLSEEPPIIPGSIRKLKPGGLEKSKISFQKFKEFLIERKALIIHHQHAGPILKKDFIPELFRLVEIYSIWGNAEYFGCPYPISNEKEIYVQDYLSYGWKLGFTGGSDCHAGHPGWSNWLRRQSRYQNGLTAVYAKELTREAIWEALWQRRCYATTGCRMIISFKINNYPMGSVVKLPSKNEKRKIKATVIGTHPLDKIELIKNNKTILVERGKGRRGKIDFIDERVIKGEDYYYLRITQKNGEIGWTSPIWFC
jgi:hypothetical protein